VSKTAFEILGVAETATPEEVKLAWRRLCKEHHPDRGGNGVVFNEYRQAYNEAYQLASQPKICEVCNGTGKIGKTHGVSTVMLCCNVCHGKGKLL
jgi:DnaJ-class molecular chaperone